MLHLFTSFWSSLYVWLNPLWSLTVSGKENIDSKKTYVFVSNHQSMVDILILFRIFAHFKWVSKIENFKIPFIGWNMHLNSYIQLDRGKVKSNYQMMKDASFALKNGNSLMIFPEGTRSLDGKLRSFKSGAFQLAKENKISIIPIVINGTSSALPKGGVIFQGKQKMSIRILPEITPESFESISIETLTELVQKKIDAVLNS
jgi:1-acyl-sn-glycerol-3-phosphate acyltransferase